MAHNHNANDNVANDAREEDDHIDNGQLKREDVAN